MKKINFKGKSYKVLKEELGDDYDKIMYEINCCLLIENEKLSNKILELLNKVCVIEKEKIKENKYLCLYSREG